MLRRFSSVDLVEAAFVPPMTFPSPNTTMPTRMMMIPITVSTSMRVNPRRRVTGASPARGVAGIVRGVHRKSAEC